MIRTIKPKTKRVKRALDDKAPKLFENIKKSLVLKGKKTSEIMNHVLQDLHSLKKPHSVLFTKNNDLLPFEETTSLEFLTKVNDTSLFALGAHTKKKPHCLTLGNDFIWFV